MQITLDGPEPVKGISHDNGNGSYTAEFTVSVTGSYEIAVQLNGVHIANSPFSCSVIGTDLKLMTACNSLLQPLPLGRAASLMVKTCWQRWQVLPVCSAFKLVIALELHEQLAEIK